jgi:hypothetical protein
MKLENRKKLDKGRNGTGSTAPVFQFRFFFLLHTLDVGPISAKVTVLLYRKAEQLTRQSLLLIVYSGTSGHGTEKRAYVSEHTGKR